jgi:uncharacterized delta-60 repeat protein
MRIRSFHRLLHAILVISFLLCFLTAAVSAQPELDITFNGTGMASANFLGVSDIGYGVVVQADNKIIVGGKYTTLTGSFTHFGLVRYNEDGTLDTTYGDGGRVMTVFDPNGIYEGANAIAIQPDGKVLAAGFVSLQPPGPGYFAIARYNTDGTLDSTFGAGGKTSAAVVNHINELRAITVAPDGQIAASGFYFGGLQNYEAAVLKLNSNGSRAFMSTFTTGFNLGDSNIPNSVAIQPDGKVVTGGGFYTSSAQSNQNDIVFARFNADGTRDTTFGLGGAGRLVISGPLSESIGAIKLLPDGKIMAVGSSAGSFLLMRITSDGFVDNSFDGDGRVTTSFTGDDYANSLFIRPDGKMIVSGYANGALAVAVYNVDGSLDTGFSGDGKLTFWSARAGANSLSVDSLGRVVVGGWAGTGFGAARLYTLDPVPVSIYGRTLTQSGNPIVGLSVGLTDRSGVTRWTLTSPFGYYQFDGVMSGQTVTLSVSSKRYLFDPKAVGVNENLADIDMVGLPTQNRPGEGKIALRAAPIK